MSPASTATARQTVTIIGPNLRDQSKGTFHVHAAGCGDIARQAHRDPAFRDGWDLEADSLEAIAAVVYSDIIAENEADGTACNYLGEFHFAPCVTLPDTAPTLTADEQAKIADRCTDALSDIIIEGLGDAGFDESNSDAAQTACYDAVVQKIAPPNIAGASTLLSGDWDAGGSDTVYLPRDVGDRLLERQGWVIETCGRGANAYTMPGGKPRSEGGTPFVDYVWERGDAITRAFIAEALR